MKISKNDLGDLSAFTSEIKKELSNELSLQGGLFSQVFLEQLKSQINTYLIEANQIMLDFNANIALANSLSQDDSMSAPYKRWLIAKKMTSPKVEDTLKKGYLMFDELREAIVGEPLKYYVGVMAGRGSNRQLYEGEIPLSEILKMAKVEPIWKNTESSVFKLRLRARVSELQKSLQPASSGHSQLYGYVREYASSNNIRNQGNVFEAYRNMVLSGRFINPKGADAWSSNLFDEFMEETFSNVLKNSVSFIKGGDIGLESIKFFGGSAPSLASLSTLINLLNNFVKVISFSNIEAIKIGFQYLFEKEPQLDNAAQHFIDFADEETQQLLSTLKGL